MYCLLDPACLISFSCDAFVQKKITTHQQTARTFLHIHEQDLTWSNQERKIVTEPMTMLKITNTFLLFILTIKIHLNNCSPSGKSDFTLVLVTARTPLSFIVLSTATMMVPLGVHAHAGWTCEVPDA